MAGGFGNDKWTANLIRQFGDATFGGIAVNGDAGRDDVSNVEKGLVSMGVDAFLVVGAPICGEDAKDFSGELGVILCKSEK